MQVSWSLCSFCSSTCSDSTSHYASCSNCSTYCPLLCSNSFPKRVPCSNSSSIRVPCSNSSSIRVPCSNSSSLRVPCSSSSSIRVPCSNSSSVYVPSVQPFHKLFAHEKRFQVFPIVQGTAWRARLVNRTSCPA
jgi:hypothetical protein